MKTTQTSVLDEALELLPTRDMRYYGETPWDNREALALAERCADRPIETIDVLVELYAQILPTMSTLEQGNVLANLKRCPVRS